MLWRPEEHEPLTGQEWDPDTAREAIAEIVTDAEAAAEHGTWPNHPLDEVAQDERLCSLYLGGAGMIWGLYKLGSSIDVTAAIGATLERYRASPAGEEAEHPSSLLLGETGIVAVAQKLVRANREHETWELLFGSPGTMIAARACGLDHEWRESAALLYEHWDPSTDMWTHDLYGEIRPFIGAGHGFASNVHALRGFVDDDVLRARVTRLLTRTAHHEDGLANWPPDMASRSVAQRRGAVPRNRGQRVRIPEALRAHWRHDLASPRPPVRDARDRPGRARQAALRPRALHVVDRRHRRGAVCEGMPRCRPGVPDHRHVLVRDC